MEMPGRKTEVVESYKDEQFEELSYKFCQPCDEDGQKLSAAGFCVDCCEYLCEECFKVHRRVRPSRNHVLQDKTTMPKNKSYMKGTDMNGDKCNEHQDEKIKFYCGSHGQYGCGTCIAVDHHNCEGVRYVEKEFGELSTKLTHLKERIVRNEKSIKDNNKSIEHHYSNAIVNIEQYRNEINDLLDKLQVDIIKEAKTILEENQAVMSSISTKMDDMKKEINSKYNEITSLHNLKQSRKLFAIIDQTKDELKSLDNDLIQMQNENTMTKYAFEPEKQLKDLLGNLKSMGYLSVITRSPDNTTVPFTTTTESQTTHKLKENQQQQQHQNQSRTTQTEMHYDSKLTQTEYCTYSTPTQTEYSIDSKVTQTQAKHQNKIPDQLRHATHISDINIKSSRYGTFTSAGLTLLSDNQLVIADYDYFNRYLKLKLANMTNNTITSEIQLSSAPWDVTTINDIKVAVTLPGAGIIQLLSVVSQSLSIDRDIKVNGGCRGIVYNDGTLIVTFTDPGKVEIINMSGGVLRSMEKNASGTQLFEQPRYIAINPDKSAIYVSDYTKHSVTCMTLDGNVKAVYMDDSLKGPEGLVADRTGTVYVCGYGSNNIHQITAECTKIQILLDRQHGISEPHSITYCDTDDKLHVGMWQNDNVKTFQLRKD